MMGVLSLGKKIPSLGKNVWVAPSAYAIGSVNLGEDVGLWFGAVLRGDNEPITIGARTNIQEHAMLHTDIGYPLEVGDGCTIGHRALLHGCKIGRNSLIGMGAMVMNGAVVGENCLIGAGALITEGKVIPDGSLVIGAPASVKRMLNDVQINSLRKSADHYVERKNMFQKELGA